MLTQKLAALEHEYEQVEAHLADPNIISDQGQYRRVARRHRELTPIVNLWREYCTLDTQARDARELLSDPEMRDLARADLDASEARMRAIDTELEVLLLPTDPHDPHDCIVEIRAGAGGDEAALFAADLLSMYERYAEGAGLKLAVLDANESDLGGLSKVTFEVTGDGAFRAFRFERGVHRVQRVPATETQGRIHTSTVTVAVLPQVEDAEVDLDLSEVRIDVFRSQGAGGQGVNTTDSAVRAVYRPGTPDEIVVVCQDGRSQIKNREKALVVLRARLAERERAVREAQERADRAAQVGSGDRSEKIRTYNYPQNRVTDHRLSGDVKNFPLETVVAGGLAPLIAALVNVEREALLQELTHAGA
ncbi:peptide chain release factor 1 [Deinococcus maricopensis]|uniref:Peptide chain release factor 1 n=1 Tax=Deinococcus maricopensis (strain DSM 21211 / LMG 22137 / NRRL B-23946 / LB-34) TaxID=709986 RepID=E8U7R9_DEIML|nr:peptide chain release factor 1 [Deinococcus maricopensis]ADV67108.1 Peptide chain release factor 1 [Deinococcus maricopensis DSM 21211]